MPRFVVWYWRGGKWYPADPYVASELGGHAGNVEGMLGALARMGYPGMRRREGEGPPVDVRPLGQTYDIDVARSRARVALVYLGHVDLEETAGGWHCPSCGGLAHLDRLGGTKTGIDLIGTLVSATCEQRRNHNRKAQSC